MTRKTAVPIAICLTGLVKYIINLPAFIWQAHLFGNILVGLFFLDILVDLLDSGRASRILRWCLASLAPIGLLGILTVRQALQAALGKAVSGALMMEDTLAQIILQRFDNFLLFFILAVIAVCLLFLLGLRYQKNWTVHNLGSCLIVTAVLFLFAGMVYSFAYLVKFFDMGSFIALLACSGILLLHGLHSCAVKIASPSKL